MLSSLLRPSLALLHCPELMQVPWQEGHHPPLTVSRHIFRLSLLCRFLHLLCQQTAMASSTLAPLFSTILLTTVVIAMTPDPQGPPAFLQKLSIHS